MKLTKQLKEYLINRDFYNTFEIANAIQDYIEWKHEDNREIPSETYDLAIRYIKQNEMFLEDEERTRKRLFDFLDGYTFVDINEIAMAINDYFNWEDSNPSYWELAHYGFLAEEYAERKNIKFEE